MTVDLGKIENVAGFVIQHSCEGSSRCAKYVSRVQVEYSVVQDSGFVKAHSSYDGGVDFYPNNHLPKPYRNYHDKIWQLFASPVRARYIKYNPMLNTGQDAFFRAGVIVWPDLACSECPLSTFKNYTGNRSKLYDLNVLSECQSCPYLSSTTTTGSSSCSCSPGAYIDIESSDSSVCRGCGLGMYLSNDTCNNCLDNTFSSEANARMCVECNNASFVQDHPRSFCLCKNGFTSEIVEVNPPDNMRYFSFEDPTSYSGIGLSRSRLDAYWIIGPGGGFGGWITLYQSTPGAWLAMDLGFVRRVNGVVIQSGGSGYGGGYCNQASSWVTVVSVEHSIERNTGFVNAKNQANGGDMFYPVNIGDSQDCIATRVGCSEACSARRSNNIFQEPVMARYIKIRVWNWVGTITMRAGVLIVSDDCKQCPANTYKDYAGLPTAGLSCNPCQPGSVSHPGSVLRSQCNCSAGYFRNGSTSCPSCAGGYYSLTQDVPECTQCPAHTFTAPALHPWNLASDCVVCKLCNTSTNAAFTDHYDAARGGLGCGVSSVEVCTQCPSASSLFLPTTESQRNFGVRSCVCDKHFYGVVGTACAACPSNQVRPDFINSDTTLADCLCAPGFEPDPGAANLCRQCPIGTYKELTGDHNCTKCPVTFTTEKTGNRNASACVCAPRFGLTNDACEICSPNTYKDGFNIDACLSCRADSSAPAGSIAPRDCLCNPGFSIEVPESFKKDACMQYTAPSAASVTSLWYPNHNDYYTDVSFAPKAIERAYYDWNDEPCGNIPWDFYGDAVVMTGRPENFNDMHTNYNRDYTFTNSPVSSGHYLGNICYMAQRFYGSHVGCFNQAPYWPTCEFNTSDSHPRRPKNMPCQSAAWTSHGTQGCQWRPLCVPPGGIKLYFEVFIGTSDWRQTRLTWVSVSHRHDWYFDQGLWSEGVEVDGYPVCGKYVKGSFTLQQNNPNCRIFSNSLCTQQSPVWPYYTQYSTWTKYETLFSPWCKDCRPGYNDKGTGVNDKGLYGGTPFTFDDQGVCKSKGSPAFNSQTPANWLWARDYKNSAVAVCQLCLPGHYKNATANLLCSKCPPNSVTTNTGSLACEACAAGKTTDGRTGQVECVCDVGTEPDADGICQTCRAGSYKATSTDKWANRACVNCNISCGANQQVASECNNTHEVTCRACQANSWSSAGRTRFEPCLCNAGYELQGELCVACPIGKARQANANNSIMCETCAPVTFTSVSATVSCSVCSAICSRQVCKETIYDFSKIPNPSLTSWKNYAASIGATTVLTDYGFQNGQVSVWVNGGRSDQIGYIQLPLPNEYNHVTVFYYNPFFQDQVRLFMNDVEAQAAGPFQSREYRQEYSSATVLRIQEQACVIGANIKIILQNFCDPYVRQECNASRDVICEECQTCRPGFYANNTCGANYSNDRLDTQCAPCPEDLFCPGTSTFQQPLLCSDQRCAANQQVATLCNTTHNVTCKACQANSWSYAGRTLLDPCFCNAGYELQGELCVACPVGKARQANANNSIMCEVCVAGTFTRVSASITCQLCANDCPDNTFSPHVIADFTGIATQEQKNTIGDIPYYDANWNMPGAIQKWINYAESKGATVHGFTGEGGGGLWGSMGFIQFTLPAGYNWFYLTVPHPNVLRINLDIGLRVFINDMDVHKCMPPGCDYKREYTPLQRLKVMATGGIMGYDFILRVYSSTTGAMATEILYVRQECNASRDVICQECQKCGPGFFANNTCGVNYGNDRLDTQCVPCPAGSYCPTGLEPPIPCPDNGKSPPGSISEKACDCDPGYFRDVDGCSLCHFDYYCLGKQTQHAIACPPDSRTARRGSTSRLDCHCHTGYFRDPPERLDSFNCSLCLPGDFCFNNSAYNCSDALMVSAPGSGFFDNCTCVSGYYNNGTVCEDCPINYYCEGGQRLSCPANEWTAYEGRSYECVCMPGFYRDQDLCVPCTDDYFCEGLDDSRQACPQHSTGRGASEIEHCLCNSGYEAIFSTNASEPHTCRACEHTDGVYKYKTGLGNRACSLCTECLPHLHSTWTQIACTPTADALCDYCSICHNATEDSPRLLYTTHACQQFFDTRCANCTVCDWDSEWEFMPCSESGNSECSRITRDRACPVGFYAGGHTRTTDSRCIPCAVRNTPYEGEWLHHFTSAGRRYGDPYSCDLTCRAFSRLANGTDHSFGCSTCETGNVLFKEFTQNLLVCQFECLAGYAKRGEDCVLETFHADTQIYWNHSVNVTHVRREATWNNSGRGAFQLTVSHTAHGNFAVVIGKSEPTCAGRAAVELRRAASAACCFSELWRVSTSSQLGLSSTAREQCSRPDPPWSEQTSDTQLVFEVPDARIEELANCSQFQGGLACELYVSIVDTLLLHHFSVPVRLELRRASALSAVGTQTYVPLSAFRVEAQLAYVELDGSPVFVVVSDMSPLPGAGATDVALHSAGLRLAQPPPEVNCERYGTLLASSLGGDSLPLRNASAEAWTLDAAPVRAMTFLRAPQGTQFLKLFYTLRLREREGTIGTKNMMHVAVWRNLSQVSAVCDLPPPSLSVEAGEVLSCNGLGETAVAAANALQSPAETVRGEVGGLTSFVARALHPHVHYVLVKNMLVAFTLPAAAPSVAGVNVTGMHLGDLDFTDEFKAACQTTEFCHFRYVHQGGGMHFLTSCDATAQDAARAWLRSALGAVEDDGHVQALCRLAHRQSAREYAFLIALVNTRAYLPRGGQWHDLQNHSAPLSTSRVAALFEFV